MLLPVPLKHGDGVRVIAPARTIKFDWFTREFEKLAVKRLEELGLSVSYGVHLTEHDAFESSTIEHRIEDLHEAFRDPSVRMILTTIGGFNSNQLLKYIDYDLIRRNPKRLCGFSDITALTNAITAKTGLVTYSGPHFFNFGQKVGFEYTQEQFVRCHFPAEPFDVIASDRYLNKYWGRNEDDPTWIPNPGHVVLQEGDVQGTIIGGNLCTLNLLQGTEFMPQPEGDVILFAEDDNESHYRTFDRDLQSFLHQPIASRLKGLVIGRFQEESKMTTDLLRQIIETKRELKGIPVIADVDFGHTLPMITFPIGGTMQMSARKDQSVLKILSH